MPALIVIRFSRLKTMLGAVVILLLACPAWGQSYAKLMSQGDEAFGRKDYRAAIQSYEAALAQKPGKTDTEYRLGLSYLQNKQPEKAKPRLVPVYRKTKKYNPELLFMLGQAYHFTHGFDSAMFFYREFREKLKRNDHEAQERIEKFLEECRVGAKLVANPVNVRLENLGPNINSANADIVPVMTEDEATLIFTSRRQGSTGNRTGPDGEPLEDVYISTKENGKWAPAKNIGAPINSERHDACAALSADGKKLYLYKDTNGGDIYVSERKGNTWSEPVSLGSEINSPYYEPSLTVSADGDYVFFSSNRPGGFGGLDLYVSVKQPDGTWGEAMNLGAVINSAYDEDAPYLHSSGNTLYFSSRGGGTMGGHDIFKSEMTGFTWIAPVNLGYPINTAYDDIHYIVPSESRHAYYSTTRANNFGRQDIYQVIFPADVASDSMLVNLDEPVFVEPDAPVAEKPAEPAKPIQPTATVQGLVTDLNTRKPLPATLTFANPAKTGQALTATADSATGAFTVLLPLGQAYTVNAQMPGYLYYSGNITVPAQAPAGSPITHNVALTSISIGAKLVLQNVYFETGKAVIQPAAFTELDKLQSWLAENNSLKIEISGHTDNTGRAEINKQLSEQRARAVADYLIGKGIDAERIISKGFGAERPISSNSTEEGRKKNRRTEFRIIEK